MVLLVAFDGSNLATTALRRATTLADGLGEDVFAVSVVPDSERYARERDWMDDETFDVEGVATTLRDRVHEVAPDATFEAIEVDRFAGPGTIAQRIRQTARRLGASLVFLGSQNAGRVVRPVTSEPGAAGPDPEGPASAAGEAMDEDGDTSA